jgi:hypothetical protein
LLAPIVLAVGVLVGVALIFDRPRRISTVDTLWRRMPVTKADDIPERFRRSEGDGMLFGGALWPRPVGEDEYHKHAP